MSVEYLRPQDATLWCAQASDAPLQIGAVCLFEGGPLHDESGELRADELCRHLEVQLQGVPRFRQKLASVPLGMGLRWVDDPDFDMAHHFRVATLPHPGDETELREFVSRLLEAPLDPNHPLWEIWNVDGVTGDRVAVIVKVSHVMADGMAVLDLALSLLDAEPRSHDEVPRPWAPASAPGTAELLVSAAMERTRRQIGGLWDITRQMADPRRVIGSLAAMARLGTSSAARAPALPVTRPVGPHRDFAWIRLPWKELDRVKHAEGVKLNDVVLAISAAALADYLAKTGARLDGRAARVLVPASMHGTAAEEEIENRFSLIVADLPIAISDPIERLHSVYADMRRQKDSSHAAMASLLFEVGDLVPQALLSLIGPVVLRHQPFVNLAVTNLPGTREPMFLLGSRMLELYPYICVTGNIAVIIGVLSYENGIHMGVTVDSDVVPDVDRLIEGIERAAAELVDASDTRPVREAFEHHG